MTRESGTDTEARLGFRQCVNIEWRISVGRVSRAAGLRVLQSGVAERLDRILLRLSLVLERCLKEVVWELADEAGVALRDVAGEKTGAECERDECEEERWCL